MARSFETSRNWGAFARDAHAHALRLAAQTARLMTRVAAGRADRARTYRALADGCSDEDRRRRLLEQAGELDDLAERARRFAAVEADEARRTGPS